MHNGFLRPTATDAAGKTQRGTLQAEGQKQVRQWLREQKTDARQHYRNPRNGGWRESENRGEALHSGAVDVYPSAFDAGQRRAAAGERAESDLEADGRQKLAAMVVEIREKVVEGHTLFDAFSQFPRTFDKLYCTLVMAGEKTGHGRRAGEAGGVQRAAPENEK